MGILLPNVMVEVNRSRYIKNTGQTTKPQPYLNGVRGNLSPMTSSDYVMLSAASEPALRSNYVMIVSSGTDIVIGDVISKIYELDGKTPWGGAGPLLVGQPGYGNVVWWVRYHVESAPGFLRYRTLYLERAQVGGPA